MSASHPSEAATRVTVGDHTFFPDNAARDLEAMAYEYETNLRFKLDSTSAGLFLRNVAHGLRMCARTFDLAARSPAPTLKHPDQFLVRIERPGGVRFMEATAPTLDEAAEGVGLQRRAAPSVEARDSALISAAAVVIGAFAYYPNHEETPADQADRVAALEALADARTALLASLLPPEKT